MQAHFLQIQNALKERIICRDTFDIRAVRTVAGVDLAYWKCADTEYAVCCIVVLDFQTHAVLEKKHCSGRIDIPYMPGFLAFRELPLVLQTARLLEQKPDLYLFDGNGYLHPRHMGIASQASFDLHAPTVGVAKTYFRADGHTDYTVPAAQSGSYTDIVMNRTVYGRALRTHDNVRPVFVSVGNGISLDTATDIVMQLTERDSRIPLPTRLADLETHIERNRLRDTNML